MPKTRRIHLKGIRRYRKKRSIANFFMGKTVSLPITVNVPVWLGRSGSSFGYSLSQTAFEFTRNVTGLLVNTQNFVQTTDTYSMVSFSGIRLKFVRGNSIDYSSVQALPQLYIDMVPYVNDVIGVGLINSTLVNSPTALRVQVVNTTQPIEKTLMFPDVMLSANDTPLCGRKIWHPCYGVGNDPDHAFYLAIGYNNFPTPPFANDVFIYIGDIQFTLLSRWGKALPMTSN